MEEEDLHRDGIIVFNHHLISNSISGTMFSIWIMKMTINEPYACCAI